MKKAFRVPLAALLVVLLPGLAQAGDRISGRAKVLDGDSLEVAGRRVRLWGIDAPEYAQTCTRDGQAWTCGKAAIGALRAHLSGRSLSCEVLDIDAYARAVARCQVQGQSLNEWMVHQGWALEYQSYSGGAYSAAQSSAKLARRGIWDSQFENPQSWRRRHARKH